MPYQSLSWAEIQQRLADKYEAVPWWTSEDARAAFNEGLRTYNLLTGRWSRRETLTTVADQYLYTASASMLFKARITFNSLPMDPASRQDLNNSRYTWRTETTTSGGDVPTRPIVWAPISPRSFYLWPADAVGDNTLTLDGVSATPIISTEEDLVDLGEQDLNILLGYSLHVLSFSKGGQFFEATKGYWRDFLAAAAEENGQIKTLKIYRRVMGWDRRDLKPLRGAPVLSFDGDGIELKGDQR